MQTREDPGGGGESKIVFCRHIFMDGSLEPQFCKKDVLGVEHPRHGPPRPVCQRDASRVQLWAEVLPEARGARSLVVEAAGGDVDVEREDEGVSEEADEGEDQPEEDRATPAAEPPPHARALVPSPWSERDEVKKEH